MKSTSPEVALSSLDIGHLALFAGLALQDQALGALHARGFKDLRFAHGFVFQHLVGGDRTLRELAERMEISQQAAHKAVAELETLGYVERIADATDGRVRRVHLAPRGWAAVEAGRAIREEQERELVCRFGDDRLAEGKRLLMELLGGGLAEAAISARRVRWPG